ncbi:unnamed protein product [Darwinula stevensoni]|uniref:Uncharacterized protein n=1 Tax=Darwinula stevensoni TaxID=69355 RepID=A0A7R8X8T4_9CRUS|nr:unnamed protein product [Darwinula stevensoni]CAG0888444.1 unnamed protein product [Darwinula stevensoni]
MMASQHQSKLIRERLCALDFPACARDAILEIQNICTVGSSTRGHSHHQIMADLCAEFIFCQVDARGAPAPPLHPLQELQLLDVLNNYFAFPLNEMLRNTVFLTLFLPSSYPGNREKLDILAKVLALAIANQNVPVLMCMGVWMQQHGTDSESALCVTQRIIKDYVLLVPKLSWLRDIHHHAPHFAANFMSSVGAFYAGGGKEAKMESELPPILLVRVFVDWMEKSPGICLCALTTPLKSVLPQGSIAMPASAPVISFLRWTAKAALLLNHAEMKEITEKYSLDAEHRVDVDETKKLYSCLHDGILQTLLSGTGDVMTSKELQDVMDDLNRTAKVYFIQSDSEEYSLCVERVAQVGLFASQTGTMAGRREKAVEGLKSLTKHLKPDAARFTNMVIERLKP